MKLLILVVDYPRTDGYIQLMYVHVRNKYYISKGIDVTVLNFKGKDNYMIDGVRVITLEEYEKNNNFQYDILVCHAPNIRNHYKFITKYEKKFKKIVFFFHGHEVLKINSIYSKPYHYQKKNSFLKKSIQNIYDSFKLMIWHNYIPKLSYKSYYIFVSKWMYTEFIMWTKIDEKILLGKYTIINNSVGSLFEKNDYNKFNDKIYDFITIRGNLDGSKYCIDIVNSLAKSNPKYSFLVIGKGNFFNYNKIASNITWIDETLNHQNIIKFINQAKCALMLTRTDAQGLMACEMATFGIPTITSNIDVCKEIFCEFENIEFIDNENTTLNLNSLFENIIAKNEKKINKTKKYFSDETSGLEIEVYKKILE